jgi:hypothetical protein
MTFKYPPATSTTPGIITLDGDLGGTEEFPSVLKINGTSVPATPSANQALIAINGTSANWSLITNANIDPAASITGSKINPNFGSQNVSTTGTLSAGATTATSLQDTGLGTGVVHSDASGNFTSSLIVNADVSATAAIAGSKISPNFGTQALTAGTFALGTSSSVNSLTGSITFTTKTFSSTGTIDTTTTDLIIYADTSGGPFTLTLPAPTSGRILIIKDKKQTFATNNLTLARNGTEKIDGVAASLILATNNEEVILTSDGTDWYTNLFASSTTGAAGGDLSGTYPNPTVAKINHTIITTAGGSLVTGTVLRVTGSSTADWGSVDLSNTNAVTGTLPSSNQTAQTMGGDVSGTTAAATVIKINGTSVPATPSANQVLVATSSSTSVWEQITNNQIDPAAAIAYSKLNLTNSIVNADINSAAAIAYSKLNLTGDIVNADISATAAIAVSKLASGTAAQVLLNNATPTPTWTTLSGDVTISATGVTTVNSISGASPIVITPAVLSFVNTTSSPTLKQADLTTNSGAGQALTIQAQNETGTTSTGGALNLTSGTGTTAAGAVTLQTGGTTRLTANASGVITIANLSTGVVHADSSGNLTSSTIVNADVSSSAAIAVSKLAAGTSGQILQNNGTPTPTWTTVSGDVSITNAGATTVAKINGTTVTTAGGTLTTGQVLRVTGASSSDWGPLDLSNASAITGTLPAGNQASQTMGGDVTGTTAASTVVKIQGNTVTSGALTKGNILIASSTSNWAPSDFSGDVTNGHTTAGLITVTGIQGNTFTSGAPTQGQFVVATTASNYGPVTLSGDISESATTAGLLTVTGLQTNPVQPGTLTATQDGYVLTWTNSANQWQARAPGSTIALGIDFQFSNTSSDISAYDQLLDVASGSQADLSAAVTLAGGKTLIKAYGTPVNLPGVSVVPAGLWEFNCYAYSSLLGAFTTQLIFDVYTRVGSTETLLFSVTGPNLSVTSVAPYNVSYNMVNDTFVTDTTRIVIKVSAITTSITGVTAHFVFDGTVNTSVVRTPISGDAIQLGGDLSGTTSSATVLAINGTTVPASPSANQVLVATSGTAATWQQITNAQVSSSAAIAYSKLNLSNSIVNADVNSAAAIAYSKLNLSASIVNADIASGAAIAVGKLAAGTSGQILQNNGTPTPTWTTISGDVTISNSGVTTVTAISGSTPINITPNELKFVAGATPSIDQASISSASGATFTITAQGATGVSHNGGDLDLSSGTSGSATVGTVRLQTGGTDRLTVSPTNVAIPAFGTAGVVHNDSSGNLTSSMIVNADISSSAAIAVSKLAAGTAAQVLLNNATPTPTWTTLSGDVTVSATGATTVNSISGASPIAITPSVLQWTTATVNPTLKQADLTTNSGAGQALTIQAQNETGTTSTGGALNLTSGTGTTTAGATTLQTGGTTRLTANATGVITIANLGTGVVHADSSGNLTSSTIVNADISATAAIAVNKLAAGTAGQVLLNNATPTPTWTTLSGDVTVSATGVTTVNSISGASPIAITPASLQWTSATSSPTLTQASTSAGSGTTLTIQAQGATGASNNGGNLSLTSGTSGSATVGSVNIQTGTNNQITITPTTTTIGVAAANTSTVLQVGGTTNLTLTSALLQWATGITSPTFNQANNTTNGATATSTTLQAQNATGTTSTGGALNLTSGTGTTAAGNVVIQTGGTARVTISPTNVTLQSLAGNGTGVVAVNNTGVLSFIATPGTSAPINWTTRTETTDYTVDATAPDYIILCNFSAGHTITLPTPTAGRAIIIKDISGTATTNNITIARHSTETIDGTAASLVYTVNYGSIQLVSDGTNWWTLS